MGKGLVVTRSSLVGPTESSSFAPGHSVFAWASRALCSGAWAVFSGAGSGFVTSRVWRTCRLGCSCATAALTTSASTPASTQIMTAAVKTKFTRRMRPPTVLVVPLWPVPTGSARSSPVARSGPHRLVRVYEPRPEVDVFSFGPYIRGGPLYTLADLGSRAALGGEQTGQRRHVRGGHARTRLRVVATSGYRGQDLDPGGGHVDRLSVVRETGSPVLLVGGRDGDHVLISRGIAGPARGIVAGSGHHNDIVFPGVIDGVFEYPVVSIASEREVYGPGAVLDAPVDALGYVVVEQASRI